MRQQNSIQITAKKPHRVSNQEIGRINYAYTNITQNRNAPNPKPFKPVEGVLYSWVYLENPETGNREIILGIEKPWLYPQAFIEPLPAKPTPEELKRFENQTKAYNNFIRELNPNVINKGGPADS